MRTLGTLRKHPQTQFRNAYVVLLWVIVLYSCDYKLKSKLKGFPGGAVVENLPANAGDTGSSPGLGRSHMLRSN